MELPELQVQIWQELGRACAERSHGWRFPVLATRDGDGVDARTVVLREVEPSAQRLRFFTDARSPKVAQIQAHAEGSLVAWCPSLQWQLRARLRLQVETEGLALSSRWAAMRLRPQAHDYLSPLPPGTPLGDAPASPVAERGHFALINAEVLSLDWLGLRRDGHRRARFDAQGSNWLTP